MQKDTVPSQLPNTFRDSNGIPSMKEDSISRSTLNIEPKKLTTNIHHSIIRSIEPDYIIDTNSNSNEMIDRSRGRSIVQTLDNEHEEPNVLLQNTNSTNENHEARLEASGFDINQSAELDADAAFALRLQQEEYSRESLIRPSNRHFLYGSDPDDESIGSNTNIFVGPGNLHFDNDETFAEYLQQQENENRSRYRQRPFFSRSVRQRPHRSSDQTSENNDEENSASVTDRPLPPWLMLPRNDDDDDDGDNDHRSMQHAELLRNFFGNIPFPIGEGGPRFYPGTRRRRRTGNLQDTEEDFGPEDYERLLQLDDAVRKKQLSHNQINTIKKVYFQAKSDNAEENNKCSICLEFFEAKQALRQFPCDHVYHKECGDRWLRENNVCPICRKPPVEIESSSNSYHHRSTNSTRQMPTHNRNPQIRNSNRHNQNSTNGQHRGMPPNKHKS